MELIFKMEFNIEFILSANYLMNVYYKSSNLFKIWIYRREQQTIF